MRLTLWLMLACALFACSKKAKSGDVRLQQISDSFSAAGFKLDGFSKTDATRFGATQCVLGMLEGIVTLVCEFDSPASLAIGKPAGEAFVSGATTAAVLGNGRTLLAVADRTHIDPHGKTIHKITQAFTKTR
jgi:hypothetical protein